MLCIGHRGAAGHVTENTLDSFQKALDLGSRHIELDVHCVEGELLVFHDFTLDRMTGEEGRLGDHDLNYLRELNLPGGLRIPTLAETYQLVGPETGINIELKGPGTAALVADFIAQQTNSDWALVSSSNFAELIQFRQLTSTVRLGALIHWENIDLGSICLDTLIEQLAPYSLHLPLNAFLGGQHHVEALLAEARSRGLRVFVYTVNEPEDIALLANMAVDGVFTDYPDRVPLNGNNQTGSVWP